jgi:PAS domain S-box-containing protein
MENEFSRLVDALPGLAWTTLPDGRTDFINQRWYDYTGMSRDEAAGFGWHAAIHPDDRPHVLDHWGRFLASGEPGVAEGRLRRHDGVYRWFTLSAAPLVDASGRIVKWCGVNTDIDARKQAEIQLAGEVRILQMVTRGDSLRQVLEALCALVEEIAAGCLCSILIVDPSGERFQVGAGPSLPEPYNDLLEGKTIDPKYGPCSLAVVTKAPVITADLAHDPRWDASAWVPVMAAYGLQSCWSMPISSGGRKVLGVFAVYRHEAESPTAVERELIDWFTNIAGIVIERAQIDAALLRSEAYLEEAQKLSQTGSFGWRLATDRHFWSNEILRIFGYEASTAITLDSILSRVHPEDAALARQALALAADGHDIDFEPRLLMPDGAVKHVHVVAHGGRDRDGQLEYVGAVQDVTERRLAEETLAKVRSELAHVSRVMALGTLTASIAHEVNQPLSGIITNASTCLRMLAADPPNIDGARQTATRTIRDGHRAADVITRLRALFSGKNAKSEAVDLNEATREVIALSTSELQRSRVAVRSDLADGLPRVPGDRVQLQQVVLNLLLNAMDATCGLDDRPRLVEIRTELDDEDHIRLTVRDNGVGFESQDVQRLFEAFHTTKSNGMGIGLSVSRSIIESHGGRLWAAANEGPGATFSFCIPRNPESLAEINRPEVARAHAETPSEDVARPETVVRNA